MAVEIFNFLNFGKRKKKEAEEEEENELWKFPKFSILETLENINLFYDLGTLWLGVRVQKRPDLKRKNKKRSLIYS